jgi:hypothetical protein
VSSVEDQQAPALFTLPPPDPGGTRERLDRLRSALADVLCVLDDDARQLDASLRDTHELVRDIRTLLRQLRDDGALLGYAQRRACDAFELARIAENDAYEVLADDLERFRKRRQLNLGVVELDSDKRALVQCRREYIATLRACQTPVSAIVRGAR